MPDAYAEGGCGGEDGGGRVVTTRVYRFAARSPIEGTDLVDSQIALAHQYRNDLVAIERGRRAAVRTVDDVAPVHAAIDRLRGAAKADRREAMRALSSARKVARVAAAEELARIEALNREIVKSAYNWYGDLGVAWGTRLRIASASDAARKEPLYGDDGVSPLDPHFHRWDRSGTAVVQLQHGLPVADLYRGGDTRAALARHVDGRAKPTIGRQVDGVVSLRVASEGRAPVWARWPVTLHRELPDQGRVTWIACTRNRHGEWSCEITVVAAPSLECGDIALNAIAVEVCWYDRGDEGICVATWLDSDGERGAVVLPRRIAGSIKKASDIQSLRDLSLADAHSVDGKLLRAGLRTTIARLLRETEDALPPWLARARDTIPYWRSPAGFRDLACRWRRERCDAARPAYDALQEWEMRDQHLSDYQRGARENGLASRKQLYRSVVRGWASRYGTILIDDRDLSREARWAEDSDVRFVVAPSELRDATRDIFGWRAVDVVAFRVAPSEEEDAPDFCERAIAAWQAGTARAVQIVSDPAESKGGAWAKRRAKKKAAEAPTEAARESSGKAAE